MSSFHYPEDAPVVRSHYEGDGCEWEFGPGVHNLGATPLTPKDAERLAEFAKALWATSPAAQRHDSGQPADHTTKESER